MEQLVENKMIKAAIFDFNGTLYLDDDINERSWKETYIELMGSDEGFDDLFGEILSVRNVVTIKKLYKIKGIDADEELQYKWAYIKETKYHKIVVEEERKDLTPGAVEALDYIKNHNLPIIMATASIKYNVDFYFEQFGIGKWFDREEVVYDDLSYPDKCAMYKEALKRLNLSGDEVILFDDSANSINNAIKAGIKKIVRINNFNKPKMANPEIKQEIKDFTELDYSIFKQN